ncbi:MAG: hypothetical protein JXR46_09915 [Calditrichaceae bacterium]|nr:hypothetical protein [Calditrichaceae bacterium]
MLYKLIIIPFRQYLKTKANDDLSPFAAEIGDRYQGKDKLVNLYQLIVRDHSAGTSEVLKEAAIKSLSDLYYKEDFNRELKLKKFIPDVLLIFGVLFVSLFLLILFPKGIIHSTLRLLNPSNEYAIPPVFQFDVIPGSIAVIKGDELKIKSTYQGPVLKNAYLYLINPAENKIENIYLMKGISDTLTVEIMDIKASFQYRIKGEPLYNPQLENRIWSELYEVKVKSLPEIQNLDISIHPPVYTELSAYHLERNIGDFTALSGTNVQLKIESDKVLSGALITFGSGLEIPMSGKDKKYQARFSVNRNDTYHIVLSDTSGLQNKDPIEYYISLLDDASPVIEIIKPGEDLESPLDATLEITASTYDDYGIDKAFLVYRYIRKSDLMSDTNWTRTKFAGFTGNNKQRDYTYNWDFNLLPVAFDDGIEYYAYVQDNRINNPGVGRSRTYSIRFPSLDEIFNSVDENQEEQNNELEDISRESKQLKNTLQELSRELKQKKNIEWEKKQEIQEAINKQEKLEEKLKEIQKSLDEMVQKLEQNKAISEEILDKYTKIQELFNEIATPELREAIKELQKAMEENNPAKLSKAFENFRINQEAFQKQLDRTYELLKKAQLEQKMDQLVQQARELKEQQHKITRELQSDKTKSEELKNRLASEEEKIQQKLEKLEKQVDKFMNESMMAEYDKSQNNLKNASALMSDPALQSLFKETQQHLKNQRRSNSISGSQKLEENLEKINSSLSQAQTDMLQQSRDQIERKMKHTLEKILSLSHEQEKLQISTQNTSPLSDELKDITRSQGQLMNNFQRMIAEVVELSRETFFIDRSVGQSLGNTQKKMMESLDQLSERSMHSAANSQREALKNLNLSAQKMQNALQQLLQSQSGLGMEKFLEDMKKMAGMQGQLNEQTLGLMPGEGNEGSMSMEAQAARRRIAAEQNALREAMEEMHQQMGDRGDVAGRLNQIANQMDEVINDLLNDKLSRKTIERQQQILSRMLDSQKSMTERKESKKREAEKAKAYSTIDPKILGKTSDERKEALQEALKRAQNEGYNHDYQKLIEIYFKSLIQDTQNSIAP